MSEVKAFPASFEEYLDLLPETELRAEYTDENIVLLSYASAVHEELVMILGFLLNDLRANGCRIYGSNHRVFKAGMPKSFAPDVLAVKKPARFVQPGGKASMIANPWLIVEILSPSTKAYDLGTKLPAYKTFASAEYILYLDSEERAATLHRRISPTRWSSEDYNFENGPLAIGPVSLSLRELYGAVGEEE